MCFAIISSVGVNLRESVFRVKNHKEHPEGREGWRQKTTITTARQRHLSKTIDSCERAVKSLRPC